MRFFLGVLLILLGFLSCTDKNKVVVDTSAISVDFTVKRHEVDFYTANKQKLPKVKNKYPYLFPEQLTDSISLVKISDTNEQDLFAETQKIYADFTKITTRLRSLFKHIKYYNTNFKAPDVITLLTNIDYNNRIIYADSLLFISLDAYLGKNHEFYANYPKYIKENNTQEHLIVDVASSIIAHKNHFPKSRSFINKMIIEGKKMYLLDAYLPHVSDKEKIGYSQDKLDWAIANEAQVWMYFIENKILFSTDTALDKRFLENAPFSKFYRDQDHLSPGKIGVWMGWQIVKSFMKENDVSLQELIKMDENIVFNSSKYKPKK